MKTVVFSHGLESGPWGTKFKLFAKLARAQGWHVQSVDYSDLSCPELRVSRLREVLAGISDPVILCGSSMGGYVSIVASITRSVRGIFLLAPALHSKGYEVQDYPVKCSHVTVVHGWSDEVLSFRNSVRFAESACASLHLLDGDHRLKTALDQIAPIWKNFLEACEKDET